MKNLLKLTLVFVAVFSTIAAKTIEIDFLLHAKEGKGKEITFIINGTQYLDISIFDKEGDEIYKGKATGKGGILKTYDLEQLPTGEYFLILENETKKLTYEIIITDNNARISSKNLTQVYKLDKTGGKVLASK